MKKAIIYTRAKLDLSDCSLASVESQIKSCNEFANRNELQVIGVYSDIVASETKSDFGAWNSIVKSKKPDYNCIIIYDYSRIGRNATQTIKDRAKLKEKGVRIVTVLENLDEEYDDALFDCLAEFLKKEAKKC